MVPLRFSSQPRKFEAMGDCHFNKLGFIAPCHENSFRYLFHIFLQVNIVEAKSSRKWLGRRLTSNLLAVNEADN